MRERLLKPDVRTHAAMVGAFCAAGRLEEAHAQFLEAQDAGLLPNATTYCNLLALLGHIGRYYERHEEHLYTTNLLACNSIQAFRWAHAAHAGKKSLLCSM